ncbi:MAG: DUF374 domain-containing protein [Candidatus Eisenbacteria sp.]|nr:DUF374 domain-containing protein [Candidatus Eisenbacteria bacterium]
MPRERSRLSTFRRRVTRSDAFVWFVSYLSSLLIRAYARTLRIERDVHLETAALDPAKVLYAFWHGRQFLLVPSFRHQGVAVMTGLSWAGRIQAGIMIRLGYPIVRGSSGRRGARALAEMKRALESGCSAAFAVDGPSGPAHKSKPGILYLAQKLGYPIVPVATTARTSWRISSTWCLYMMPAPFSRCLIVMGKPLAHAADGRLELAELDSVLMELTAAADERVGLACQSGS